MIVEGRQIVYQSPWIMALPILSVILSVIGFNIFSAMACGPRSIRCSEDDRRSCRP